MRPYMPLLTRNVPYCFGFETDFTVDLMIAYTHVAELVDDQTERK